MVTDIFQFMLFSLWLFVWVTAVMVWFQCVVDLFRDHTLSGWAKAGWAVLLIFVPWLGGLIYLIVRSTSMGERQRARMEAAVAAQQAYIRDVAGTGSSPADQIASAKALLDSGAITPAEYEALKAKVLA